jgi:hypothetical protein
MAHPLHRHHVLRLLLLLLLDQVLLKCHRGASTPRTVAARATSGGRVQGGGPVHAGRHGLIWPPMHHLLCRHVTCHGGQGRGVGAPAVLHVVLRRSAHAHVLLPVCHQWP